LISGHPGVSLDVQDDDRIVNAVMVHVVAAAIFADLLGTLSLALPFGYQRRQDLLPIGWVTFGISLSQAAFPRLASFCRGEGLGSRDDCALCGAHHPLPPRGSQRAWE
jgi:hypothetical protein